MTRAFAVDASAIYLELARRRRLPLGCKDGPLRTAARRAGLALWA
jgi:hypothetical protein